LNNFIKYFLCFVKKKKIQKNVLALIQAAIEKASAVNV